MARSSGIVRKTTTVERLPASEADPVAYKIREGLKEYARLGPSGYVEAYFAATEGLDGAKLDVFKRLPGGFHKVGTFRIGEIDPEDVEAQLIAMWRPGTFNFRPIVGPKYYGPTSMPYQVGEQEAEGARVGGDDVAAAANAVANMALVKQLKEIKEGLTDKPKEDEGMKAAEMQMFTSMMDAANRRAEQAEQRNHELQMKLLDMASSRSTAQAAGIPDLLKLLPKEAITALLAPAEGPGWIEKAVDALREFGPAITQALLQYFQRPDMAAAARAALPERAGEAETGNPQPTGAGPSAGGGRGVPIQLNEEQQEAKKVLLECIQENDFTNAYAMLEAFPGFVPTHQGPMPIGPAFLGMIDPTVTRPRIYVIQMMALVPEFKDIMPQAEAFVKYIQERLMKDQEAALKEQAAQGRESGPRPTGRGEDER